MSIKPLICFFFLFSLAPVISYGVSCADKPPAGSVSGIYRAGSRLCWNGRPLKLIGYGTTDLATRDGYDYARFLNTIRYVPDADPNQQHGVNLTRVWATGTSNSPDCFHTPDAHDPKQPSTTMPFAYRAGDSCSAQNLFPKYNMCISKVACPVSAGLNPTYVQRLQEILKEARRNGIIVDLVLFDGYFMGKRNDRTFAPLYSKNPWNPLHNNMGEKRFRNAPNSRTLVTCNALYRSKNVGDTSGYPFPEFYDICQDPKSTAACNATLNCLGLIQKAYVESMVDLVKQNSGGSDHVFFEIMNRIRFDESEPFFKLDQLKRWHDVIGYWIKCRSDSDCTNSKGDYLVSAVVGVADYNDLSCFNPANCPENTLEIFKMPNIDIANLPAHAWTNSPGAVGPCESARIAIKKFQKPVIIDSDGTFEERNDKCQVKNWAQEITACTVNGFTNSGQAHFNHLDGMTFRESAAKRCFFTGGSSPLNLDYDERYLDCHTLDTIGDATPTYLSNIVTTSVPQNCPHSTSSQGKSTWCAEACE